MSNQQSPERAKPRDGSLHDPPMPVAAQPATIFKRPHGAVAPIRTRQHDAAGSQPGPQRVAIKAPVGNQVPGEPSVGRDPRGERRFSERDFRRCGRGQGDSQRKTLTLHQYHALCTFPALSGSDIGPPFFAGAKVPSMNAVSHSRRPRASSSAINVRQSRSHVPSSSQRFNRRQHVDGLGYSAGKSHHRAPVFSTQRMPSTTARWATQGRPPRALRGKRGRSGSIWAHCASVTRTLRLATTATSGQCSTSARGKVQVRNIGSRRL